MLKPRDIYNQITSLTSALIESGLCVEENFPSMIDYPYCRKEISISNKDHSIFFKGITYAEMYYAALKKRLYNIRMIDGALLSLSYTFNNDKLISHRLSYFPSPNLVAFQNEPKLYENDELYADILNRQIVAVPIRFDYDIEAGCPLSHPISHLTLGQYKNCRIPVSSALTPYQFISFVVLNFYHFSNLQLSFSKFKLSFADTILPEEREYIHICTPVYQHKTN